MGFLAVVPFLEKRGAPLLPVCLLASGACSSVPLVSESLLQKSQPVVSQLPGMFRCCKNTKLMLSPLYIRGVLNFNLCQPTRFWKQNPPSSLL